MSKHQKLSKVMIGSVALALLGLGTGGCDTDEMDVDFRDGERDPTVTVEVVDLTGEPVPADAVTLLGGTNEVHEAICADEACEEWVTEIAESGDFTIRAEVCGEIVTETIAIDRSLGSASETQYVSIATSACDEEAAEEDEKSCDAYAATVARLVIRGIGGAEMHADALRYQVNGGARQEAECIDRQQLPTGGTQCLAWQVAGELGRYHFMASMCGTTLTWDVNNDSNGDGCVDVDTFELPGDPSVCLPGTLPGAATELSGQ